MKCLLDTHTTLWFFDNVEKLSKKVYNAILDPKNEKYVSIASVWELAIKISIGKLTFEGGVDNFIYTIEDNGFELFPLKADHVSQVAKLPFIHRDPFDRILVSTAMCEEMSLLTSDANIQKYDVSWVW